ncbi:MAG: hypothetical protein GY820_05590 [Gammaproteobacteria bacterium]|nr:hypothetical protein [Gammaproteobacteria bacterium]
MVQFLGEIEKTKFAADVRVVVLGSRRHFCIHPNLKRLNSVALINDRCIQMQQRPTAPGGAKCAKVRGSFEFLVLLTQRRSPSTH